MSPLPHLNVLLPRVRTVESGGEPDNHIRNIVLAVIFSIFGIIAIAVATYLSVSYYREGQRRKQRRLEQAHGQAVIMKTESEQALQ